MSAAGDTKSQIIDKASELMMQRGMNGFSYRDISGPLGVKNAIMVVTEAEPGFMN